MPPKKEKNKRQVLPGQKKITGFFQKGSLEANKTSWQTHGSGGLLSHYGDSNGIANQIAFVTPVKQNGCSGDLPDVMVRKRSDVDSPLTGKPEKAARLGSPIPLESLKRIPNLKCKARLFEKPKRKKAYLNGHKTTNPFSMLQKQESLDCDSSRESEEISVLELSELLSDLDDSLNDNGLHVYEPSNNDKKGGVEMEFEDNLAVSTTDDVTEQGNEL